MNITENFFAAHPLFKSTDFTSFLKNRGTTKINTQRANLAYYVRQKRLLKIKRGLYATLPRLVDAKDYAVDPYLIAANLADDAVLAYHTALEFHGVAYSVYSHFMYLTGKTAKLFQFRDYLFRPIHFPKKLVEKSQENISVDLVKRAGINIKVTSLERTVVDVLDRPDLCGGWEEVFPSLDMIGVLDIDKTIAYVLALENATTIAKVGFFLEQNQNKLGVKPQHLTLLEKHIPQQPHYFDRHHRIEGKLVKRWHLMVPASVLQKDWEEFIDG